MQSVHPISTPDIRGPLKPSDTGSSREPELEKQQAQSSQQVEQASWPSQHEENQSTSSAYGSSKGEESKQAEALEKKKDASHAMNMTEISKQAFRELQTTVGKFLFALVTLGHMLLLFIPDFLMRKLGFRSNEDRRFRLRRIITSKPTIWIGEYLMPVGSSNCIIIKGKDGSLFIRSPPEPTTNIVQTIRDEGDPSAILLSPLHDSYGDKWKQMFPNVKILTARQDMSIVNDRVKVDMALEDAHEVLENFNISDVISIADWSRYDEPILVTQLEEDEKAAVIFGCSFQNNVPPLLSLSRIRDELLGRARLGVIQIYAYMYVKSPEKAKSTWNQLSSIENLDALIFLHGEPIVGENARSCMANVHPDHMRWGK